MKTANELQQLQEELERLNDKYDQTLDSKNHYEQRAEIYWSALESLRSELAAKDKVLSFYADELTYDIDHLSRHGYIIIDKDAGIQARSILSQYKEGTHDTPKA